MTNSCSQMLNPSLFDNIYGLYKTKKVWLHCTSDNEHKDYPHASFSYFCIQLTDNIHQVIREKWHLFRPPMWLLLLCQFCITNFITRMYVYAFEYYLKDKNLSFQYCCLWTRILNKHAKIDTYSVSLGRLKTTLDESKRKPANFNENALLRSETNLLSNQYHLT